MSQYFSDQLQRLQDRAAKSPLVFRREALAAFHAYGLPRRKQDPWKYVDNSALLNLPYDVAAGTSSEIFEASAGFEDISFVNDEFQSADWGATKIRNLDLSPESELNLSPDSWYLDAGSLQAEENSYSLINAFSFERAYHLQVFGNLCLRFAGMQSYQAPRLYFAVPAGSDVCVLLDTRALGNRVYWNPYFHFHVGEGARLTLLERGPGLGEYISHDAHNVSGANKTHVRSVTLRAQVAARGRVNAALFYWGMDLAVHDARLAICGEGADVQMCSICFGENSSRYHLRCESQHLAPNSSSQCLYKNVLFDQATSEFYGIIHADNNAVGTNASQNNQNLLLADNARAIARPQLEIEIDDLKCSHGSSTGSIDAEELFYMRSRGLSQPLAMRMAVVGFVEEVSTYFADELLHVLNIPGCLQNLLGERNS